MISQLMFSYSFRFDTLNFVNITFVISEKKLAEHVNDAQLTTYGNGQKPDRNTPPK